MEQWENMERLLRVCPETDCLDFALYPLVSEQTLLTMELDFTEDMSRVHVFPFCRNNNGRTYIDLYFWDLMLSEKPYKRFVVCEGYRFSEEDEKTFLTYVRSGSIITNQFWMDHFYDEVQRNFSTWNYQAYSEERVAVALEHLYYASHVSGARGVLYRDGLVNIAFNLGKLSSYNMIGSTSEEVIGCDVCRALLCTLNQPGLLPLLYEEESIRKCVKVYSRYKALIRKSIPTAGQWRYIYSQYREFWAWGQYGVSHQLYNLLALPGSEVVLSEYEKYMSPEYENPHIEKGILSDLKSGRSLVNRLTLLRKCLAKAKRYDPMIRERKASAVYEYRGEKYMVVLPTDAKEYCVEEVLQRNNIMEKLRKHAFKKSTVLFVRHVSHPELPFVTIEIDKRMITEVRGACDTLPAKEIFLFLYEYAVRQSLAYCPQYLLEESGIWEYDGENADELEAFYEELDPFSRHHHDYSSYSPVMEIIP